MTRPALRTALAATAAALALLVTGCASGGAAPAASGSDAPAVSDAGYVTPGKLTIATGETAYEPYVIDDDPASGKGFEAAVAISRRKAVRKLGGAAVTSPLAGPRLRRIRMPSQIR